MLHGPVVFAKREAGEKVAREEGLDEPDFATRRIALEADAGAVGLHAGQGAEHCGGKVFTFGFRMNTVPGEFGHVRRSVHRMAPAAKEKPRRAVNHGGISKTD